MNLCASSNVMNKYRKIRIATFCSIPGLPGIAQILCVQPLSFCVKMTRMKKTLLDYSILSALANPGIGKSDRNKIPFFAALTWERNFQAVCFDFQLQAINITSYKRKSLEEEMKLEGYLKLLNSPDNGMSKLEEEMVIGRQKGVVERLSQKSERISSLFSAALADSVSRSFLLPGSVIPITSTHFIDESDLRAYNIEVIPLNKVKLLKILGLIDKWKEQNPRMILSDLTLLDLITRTLCACLKIDEWILPDQGKRLSDLNANFLYSRFQQLINQSELYPTLLKP